MNRSVNKLHTPFTFRAKLFTQNSAMSKLWGILMGWGPAVPKGIFTHMDWAKEPWSSAQTTDVTIRYVSV